MIKIELSWAICLYLIFTVIAIFVLWAFFERNRKNTKINPEEKFVWQCSICTYFYVDSQNEEFSICPRCGSYNKRNQKGGGKL
jgi:uncharacterized paraquat-inducible protein A